MSNKLGIAGVVVGIIGLVPWVLDMAGIDTSGALAPYVPVMLDVWRVISPFAILFGGGAIGWIIRDRSKTRDAETAARIRRENAEHTEKMKRDREEYEAEQAAKEDIREHRMSVENAARRFKSYDIDAKAIVCKAYDDGEFVFDFDASDSRDTASTQVTRMMDIETLPEGQYRYTLKPLTKEMLDANPELLYDIRNYMKRKQAAKNTEAMRANPELMLPHMSFEELQTLQKIVENSGYLDLAESGDASYDTLAEFGMIGEWTPDPDGHPICELDKDVLAFFRREENENLIAQYISYAMEDGERSA